MAARNETKCMVFKIRGRIIKVDADIYNKIFNSQYRKTSRKKYNGNIRTLRISGDGYPVVVIGVHPSRHLVLSRFIMGAKKGEVVDHIDRNTLNNRRENLQIVTPRQNSLNKVVKNNTGLIGVCVRHQKKRFYCVAQFLREDKVRRVFRLPDSPENRILAAFARDKFVLEAGDEEYAPLNFPCFAFEPFRSFLMGNNFEKYKKTINPRHPPSLKLRRTGGSGS